jgi:inosine/xanthosine triphosphatase
MKISVGSGNPIKVQATKDTFNEIIIHEKLLNTVMIESIEIRITNFNNTPNTINEMILGAKLRAEKAIKFNNADFGIGIEGGIHRTEFGIFITAFSVILNKTGKFGIGGAPSVRLPVQWEIEDNKEFELGSYVDFLSGNTNVKQKNGAMGFLTNDKITRKESLKESVICAYYSLMNQN